MNLRKSVLVLSILLISCSKEKRTENKIIDDWTIYYSTMTKTDDYDGTQWELDLDYSGNVIFHADHTGNGDTSNNNPFIDNFTWTNSEYKLIINEPIPKRTYVIQEFTRTKMYLKREYTDHNFSGYTFAEYIFLKKSE